MNEYNDEDGAGAKPFEPEVDESMPLPQYEDVIGLGHDANGQLMRKEDIKAASQYDQNMPETREAAVAESKSLWERIDELDTQGKQNSEERINLRLRVSRIQSTWNILHHEIV